MTEERKILTELADLLFAEPERKPLITKYRELARRAYELLIGKSHRSVAGVVPDDILMTRRDQIAAVALQGLLSNPDVAAVTVDQIRSVISSSVLYADAMIEELDGIKGSLE